MWEMWEMHPWDMEERGKGEFQVQITEEHPQDAEELPEVGTAPTSIPEPQGCSEQRGAALPLLQQLPEPPAGCQNQIKAGKFWQRSSEWERTRRQRCHGYVGLFNYSAGMHAERAPSTLIQATSAPGLPLLLSEPH